MFASFPPRTIHIIKCDGLFCDRLGVFCPNDIRLSDPHGLLSHDSSLFLAERGEGNLSSFLNIIIFYSCQEQWKFVMLGIKVPVIQRPPTKRVVNHILPLLAILTLILPFTASISTDAPSATCALPTSKATPLLDDSISPDAKRLPVPPIMRHLFFSWSTSIRNIAAMWQNVINVSVSATMLHGSRVIRRWRSITATSLSCNFSSHTVGNRHFLHGLPLVQAVQDIYTLKVNSNQ